MLEHDAQRAFGAWLRGVREQRGLRRPPVAKALGYTNISKGCSRLAGWERGDAHPAHHFHAPLRAILQITQAEWDAQLAAREKLRRHADPFTQSDRDQQQQVYQDLARHCDLLLAHLPEIAATQRWRDIHLPGLSFGLVYLGGITTVHLGELLAAWEAGTLQVADRDGQSVWLLSGGASPLSGSHTVRGFFRHNRSCAVFKGTFRGSIAAPLADIIRRGRAAEHGASPWNLPQLLAQLGASIAPAILSTPTQTLGRYDFATATLHWRGTQVRFPLLRADATAAVDWDAPAPVEQLETTSGTWSLRSGHLRDPQGYPQVLWSRALPPLVQSWIVHRLTDEPLSPAPRPGSPS